MHNQSDLEKEVISLRKQVQKLQSNISKGTGADRDDQVCRCEYPHFIDSTATKSGKICTFCAGARPARPLEIVRAAIANDGHAITFQTLGQYRAALLKMIDNLKGEQK